ncbi:pyridoxal phosphate-dependent aminotransferase [Zavarzinia sp. CC-PAN008]|uniref:pyridoxal phosphate-dependent aminotransferase n=1 Tax=Zavarzinia sp. CC-PAN008 TaxID=3243332 RepID=UPI003F742232
MRYSSLVERIAGEGSRAWAIHYAAEKRLRAGHDVIMLSVGDPDFETPPPVVDAAVAALRAGRTHYSHIVGQPPLRAAIARRFAEWTGVAVDPMQVVVLAGAQCAMFAASLCALDHGTEVIVLEPTYVTYDAVFGAAGARAVKVPLHPERGFHPDIAQIEAAVTPATRAIVINSPHNPTGMVLTPAELEGIAAICRRHDLWLISDEVYWTLVFEGRHVTPMSLPGMAERTIVISSLSKSHAMSGWRVGWTIAPPDMARHIGTLALCMLYGSPPFIQDAATVALEHDFAELDAMRTAYGARRRIVAERLADAPALRVLTAAGGMFAMLDIRESGLSGVDYAFGLLEDQDVSLLPADAFGPSAAGHLRLSLACPEPRLEEACARIRAFAQKVGRR